MKKNRFTLAPLLLVLSMIFISCSSDDEDPEISKGEILIVSSIPNPDGQSGSIYFQLIDDLSPKTYDNSSAYQLGLFDQVVMRGNDLYVLPFGESDIITKYTRDTDNNLRETGQLSLEANSGPTAIVKKSETKAYVALMRRAKILIINPTTMVKTGEIDITDYGVGDSNPDAQQMIIRDNKLYVALAQMVGGFFPDKDRAKVDVLIINTEADTVMKMITDDKSGMSQPTRPIESKQMFMDENNDIYIMCQGGFGTRPGHKVGILRIKDGETEFDDAYGFSITDATITGESNIPASVYYVQYAGNGKLYALPSFPAYWSDPPSFVQDRVCRAIEIDLYTKSMKTLDLPKSNSFGSVGIYEDKIIFGLSTDTEDGFYTYDLNTGETSSEAIIKTTGTANLFRHFGEKY